MSAVVEQICKAVQHNCHVADARHGGDLGMCTYLMRMREYFRWEKRLGFQAHIQKDEVGNWLTEREALWADLSESDYGEIAVDEQEFDPFDADAINLALEPHNLVYSAGLMHGAKPHFFLAQLWRKEAPVDGFDLRVTDTELARGLSAPPAMTRGRSIVLRREAMRQYIWEKLESWRWRRADNAFGRAIACYPFDTELEAALDRMTEVELVAAREHEIGEFLVGQRFGEAWNALLLDVAGTPAELMVRAVRDHIADCTRTLPMLVEQQRVASIHFFAGNLSAMRREIFPGLNKAYEEWRQDGDLESLTSMAGLGRRHWLGVAEELLELHQNYGADAGQPVAQLISANRL